MTGQAADVFVSYKAEERKRLVPLVEALEAEGFSVWWDQHISSGTHWREEIETHLESAKVVIVVWSKRSIGPEGRFVRDEAGAAQEAGHYLPITVDNVRPPLGFREVQALDLSSWWGKRSDPRFQLLCDTIRHRLDGGTMAPKALALKGSPVSRRVAIRGGIGLGAIAVAGTGAWLLLKPTAANAKRIAVLPFANLSGAEDQTYFAEGIAEELRSALLRIGLQVIGRASSDAVKDMDTKAAAAKLNVAHILTGSVRRSPQIIRVNAQLVGGKDGVESWAQTYDRTPGDAIKIQSDIAAHVANALSVALSQAGRAALVLGGTRDSVAQDLLLQARQVDRLGNTAEDTQKALALVEAAIRRDPNYAEAYVEKAGLLIGLAISLSHSAEQIADGLRLAEAPARRAIEIAPTLGSAHAQLADLESSRLNFSQSLQHLLRALDLAPDDPEVLNRAGTFLAHIGQTQEAVRIADRYIAVDPLSAKGYRRKASVLYAIRQFPQSIEIARKALQMEPEQRGPNATIGFSLLLTGRPGDAEASFRSLPFGDPFRLTGEALVAARTGKRANADKLASELWKKYGTAFSYQQAMIRAQLGQKDTAFAELNNALAARDPGLIYLKSDPFLDPIREDARFPALVKKLNFPS